MKPRILLAALLLLSAGIPARAQRVSIATNLLDWINLGTVNAQAGVSVSRHLTLHAGVRYNNWYFGSPDKGNAFQNRARTVQAGVRYWPWNVYSSWWFGGRLQWEEYNRGGLFGKPRTEEGLSSGAGAGAGYSRMLSSHWNIDVGLGFWFGKARYTQYRCPRCGRTLTFPDGTPVRQAEKWFVLPSDDVRIGLTYIF